MSLARIIFALVALIVVVDPAIGMRLINPLHDEVDNRIIGGQNAIPGQFPQQVLIRIFTNPEFIGGYFVCGGTLIDYSWVLTAAHCVKPLTEMDFYWYVISAGSINFDGGVTEQISISTDAIRHPLFFGNFLTLFAGCDVGLIKLEKPFNRTDFVEKICYAPPDYNVHNSTNTGIISGFGKTDGNAPDLPDILQWVQVPLQKDAVCVIRFLGNYDPVQYICVGKEGQTSCNGDSGGPLTTDDARISDVVNNANLNKKMVSGITSKGSGTCNSYAIYTRVSHFSKWIEEKSGIPPCNLS